eukprot:TRINITY_DN42356_c0_g1_i2.p1 TRINITY_DN42356_c0_g1~~TRINITY_DN42356_c0_g1_i2.p1  ORF type:complete len:170 (-),score=43.24 TRINITY_DN42356_c0_g1_i2:180-689(-)
MDGETGEGKREHNTEEPSSLDKTDSLCEQRIIENFERKMADATEELRRQDQQTKEDIEKNVANAFEERNGKKQHITEKLGKKVATLQKRMTENREKKAAILEERFSELKNDMGDMPWEEVVKERIANSTGDLHQQIAESSAEKAMEKMISHIENGRDKRYEQIWERLQQ